MPRGGGPATPLGVGAHGVPRSWWVLALLLHLLPFASRPALIGGDEPHYALMAHSIAVEHHLDLRDDYLAVATGSPAAGKASAGRWLTPHLRRIGKTEVFAHPLGLPLLAAPLLAVQQALAPGAAPDLLLGGAGLLLTFGALYAGVGLLGRFLGDARLGAAAGFFAYFGSPLWFYSRTFFTEPYTWSLVVMGLATGAAGRLPLAACLLGLALLTKETALLLIVPVLLAAWRLLGWRRAAVLGAGPLLFGLLFLVKNLRTVGEPFVTFQPWQLGEPATGVLGLLIEPTRGLVWFAPVLLAAALVGWRNPDRRGQAPRALSPVASSEARGGGRVAVGLAVAAAFVGYFALTAAWVDWRGGSGFGPRLLVPALPGLALPLAYLLRRLRSPVGRGVVGGLAVVGFTVGWCAALHPVAAFWQSLGAALLEASPWATATGLLAGTLLADALLRATAPASAPVAPVQSGALASVTATEGDPG